MQSNYNEYLDNYYKLKNEYDKKYKAKKSKILSNNTLTIKDKKKEINDIKKKCINCNRDGGTIFDYKDNNLIAVCGNLSNPCNLNISIKKEKVINIIELIKDIEYKINILKTDIIKVKLDFIFNFNNQELSLELFNKYKSQLQDFNLKYNDLFIKLIDITNNITNNEKLKDYYIKQDELIKKIQLFSKEFNKTNSVSFIKDTVDIYINELDKFNILIIDLKYKYNNIELIDNEYKLIQEKHIKEEFEITINKFVINSFKK